MGGADAKLAPSQPRSLGGQGRTVSPRREPEGPAEPGRHPWAPRAVRGARATGRGRARVPRCKVSCSRTFTRASCGGDASGSPLGRQPARGGRRREDKAGRAAAGIRSRLGQGRRVPGPRSRVHRGPRGGAAAGAGVRGQADRPRPADARPAAGYLPSEQIPTMCLGQR